jgi:hypothetical protein
MNRIIVKVCSLFIQASSDRLAEEAAEIGEDCPSPRSSPTDGFAVLPPGLQRVTLSSLVIYLKGCGSSHSHVLCIIPLWTLYGKILLT